MKVLLLGAKGMLGSEIAMCLKSSFNVIPYGKEELDITNEFLTRNKIKEISPEIVINTAAYTDVEGCERNSEHAFKVNAHGVKNIAESCREFGSKIVHISTDYIFDGTKKPPYDEDDQPNPLNVYGKSKLEGENFIKKTCENFLIIRSEWLYGMRGRNFVSFVIDTAAKENKLKIVNDQVGSPTYTKDLSEAIRALLKKDCKGIYNAANSGKCSWYEFARKIKEFKKIRTEILPIASDESNRVAKRPANSVLNCNKLKTNTGFVFRNWTEALKEFLESA
ncbi:MAG: dTDP-4-dehydrorhamnose reductase [Candidatus Schekmanbacteria bacterium RIFCSPHIGHO2_02_FULL_38_11]|uniref:dTDP-4-dehydrorhamnose reductase n=1 Tax=Candidatus Schekmanbacteria bacterium RIFCSPLOWO2_12_FULL_38_15 TaxID=1817883 RepID=A0A1F7SIW3_9BACT|nr:MAG: dTDP-4-dehydrorhamnose reductase [Candidatus Schekmanbacteria bacterium GWA2_38_9]OGL49256.1 MAG: dTDP-4-dehydrorhamnose reductase [Candidatus Schekmanbacteria bacterium RIFCSPLOWO2_02_FULL_38_14]OGL53711.1 MAG: dTDP-4-dehydrorhamnose reductase [Candidatus Schekmanbacteria bacterium RIFCSPLOWO2_12_FULL_38_15]OGL54730.1 MAG: dTDP-4-dehydrorhamnose reductase [Candidatus Schekmanbacteria bacterium RIFCSPHIGHO2_02_FULL_38_11]